MSTSLASMAGSRPKYPAKRDESIGICLNCGRNLTLCGKPFTAEIPCPKCLYINEFKESQQPIAGHW
jgi:hypothetical protein